MSPKLRNTQKTLYRANKSSIQDFDKLSTPSQVLFHSLVSLFSTPHGDCIKPFAFSLTKPLPQKARSLSLSRRPHPTSQKNWKPSESSSRLPTTCFQTQNLPTSAPSPQFLSKPVSFFLVKVKSSVYVLSPFPINHVLSLLSSNLSSSLLGSQPWSFKYTESYLRKSLTLFPPFNYSSISSLLFWATFLKRIVYTHWLYFLISDSFHNPLKCCFCSQQPTKLPSKGGQ